MAIGKLSERDRRIVEYFFYDPTGPSYAEIAARLGVSADTIGPLRTRCLRRLREALEDASALADPDTDHCAEG
jgi:RNA polymerase sigma factor (sigma-70 family)